MAFAVLIMIYIYGGTMWLFDWVELMRDSLAGKVIYSLLAGVVGSLIVALFLSSVLTVVAVDKALVWIVAFNAAMSGYMLLEKTGNRLPYKRLLAAAAGMVLAVAVALLANPLFVYCWGQSLVAIDDLLLLAVVATVCAGLGGLLAARYFNLR